MQRSEYVDRFGVGHGELQIGGVPLSLLAERVGSTPFFAYDRRLLDQRVDSLRAALPPGIELSYAMKANPMPAIVHHLSSRVDRIDVASTGEMHVALDAGMAPSMISFAGPGKTVAEIRQAVAAGIVLEIESSTQMALTVAAGDALGVTPAVAVRVNPDFAVKGSGMRMGGGPQQFGVDSEMVPAMLSELDGAGVDVVGFHVFAGSQNLSAEVIVEAQRRTVDLLRGLAESMTDPVRYLNLGGGFGIPYTDRDVPLDLATVGNSLTDLVQGPIAQHFPHATPVIELGRYLVGECGVYVSRVVDRKESRGRSYVVLDGGMHQQLATSGNFGQAIRRNYPIVVGNRVLEPDVETAHIVGCLCTPLDTLGSDIPVPVVEIDDLVVVFQQGAYGLTASPTSFLGHPAPREVFV